MLNDDFFDLNENPEMPDLSIIGKAIMNAQNQKSKIIIGSINVVKVKEEKPRMTLREELEFLRRDTQI